MLPPTLIASLKHIGTPIRTPTGTMSPVEGYKQFLPPVQQQPIANIPVAAPLVAQQPYQPQIQPMMMQPMMAPMGVQAIPQQQIPPEMIAQQQQIMLMQQQMIAQTQSLMQQQQQPPQIIPMSVAPVATGVVLPSQPPMMTNNILNSTPPKPTLVDQQNSAGSLLESLTQTQQIVAASGPLPAAPTPTPPQSGHASRSMSFSEKAPSVPESP